jgi:hypothetical protein
MLHHRRLRPVRPIGRPKIDVAGVALLFGQPRHLVRWHPDVRIVQYLKPSGMMPITVAGTR